MSSATSSSPAIVVLSDCVLSPPPDRLLYWLLQYCSFEGLSACRSELRARLLEASERQLQSDVDRLLTERGSSSASGSSVDHHSLYKQLSTRRDAAMAAADAEAALRVKVRQLYSSIVGCSYEHAMGLSTWLAELRDECEAGGIVLSSSSALFRLQLAAIGNMAVRAADRPRTSKVDFDSLMKHLMTYAAVTDGQQQTSPHATQTAPAHIHSHTYADQRAPTPGVSHPQYWVYQRRYNGDRELGKPVSLQLASHRFADGALCCLCVAFLMSATEGFTASKRDLEQQQQHLDELQQASTPRPHTARRCSSQPSLAQLRSMARLLLLCQPGSLRSCVMLIQPIDVCGYCMCVCLCQLAASYWQMARQANKRGGSDTTRHNIRNEYTESVDQPTIN